MTMNTQAEQVGQNNEIIRDNFNKMEAKQAIMKDFIVNYLDTFEGVFDSDESFWSPEAMLEYLTAASWMAANFRRTNNAIRKVQEKLDELPY